MPYAYLHSFCRAGCRVYMNQLLAERCNLFYPLNYRFEEPFLGEKFPCQRLAIRNMYRDSLSRYDRVSSISFLPRNIYMGITLASRCHSRRQLIACLPLLYANYGKAIGDTEMLADL